MNTHLLSKTVVLLHWFDNDHYCILLDIVRSLFLFKTEIYFVIQHSIFHADSAFFVFFAVEYEARTKQEIILKNEWQIIQ